MSEDKVEHKNVLLDNTEYTEEEFSNLLNDFEFKQKGKEADIETINKFGDTLSLDPVTKKAAWESSAEDESQETNNETTEITSHTDLTKIREENDAELKRRNVNTPQFLESINGKVYFDSPFIANQFKKLPQTTKIRQKVVKVFDLSINTQLEEFNTLLNTYIYDFSNIGNFNYQLQTFESANTWKALVMYDLLEFQNPFNK